MFQSKGEYTFGDKIMAISESFAKEQTEDVISSLKEDTLIGEADVDFCNRMEKSMASIMAYSMMKRLGIDTDYYETTGWISFDSMKGMQPNILAVCGNAICAESGNVLHDISIEVGRIERKRENGITDHLPQREELKEKQKALHQINKELLEDMKNITYKGREEKEKAEEKPEVSQHETHHENVSGSVSDVRKVEFKNLSIVEVEAGKYSLMGNVKRLNGDFENVMLTTGASREDLLKWAGNNNIDIKDISTSIKGKFDH